MKPRNNQLDARRGALILLVVWGHLLENRGIEQSLYFAIYTFHISAFAMISGMVASPQIGIQGLRRLCHRILLPLLAFQILYSLALTYFMPDRAISITTPALIIWFLFSLLTWKLLLPLVKRIPYAIPLSIIAALLVGYVDWIELEFSLSRTFVFFPAFLFGHYYSTMITSLAARYRLTFGTAFVVLFSLAVGISAHIDTALLWGAHPYSTFPDEALPIASRALIIFTGIAMSVFFFAIVPVQSDKLTHLGRRTMPVYLLHGFPVLLFWTIDTRGYSGVAFSVLTATLAIILALLLSNVSVAKLQTRMTGKG
ncbi:acyltransferase family protein [Halocynthiibacter styelae]|uniref:Acyltransferase 3 domain-containing protein n=1 Tax=Halocynthiibacter styelae TaxID=2761955 RepID=A0A8J7IVH7_9RHOB|nr:acyltransferase family protein [Paenihalocynthiibacter styelae]MBI1493459.1 hypothetical protein [Paenihalocynthiibacter styelae]